jgi:hypothetical protein
MKKTTVSLLLTLLSLSFSAAQSASTDFEILKITPDMLTTPEYNVSFGPKNKRVQKNKDWLELEVSFSWQPRAAKPEFLDDLTLNYYVLLNNKSREYPQGTLLTGTVTHVAVPQAKGMNSVMYISPRTLERFFGGKIPTTASSAVTDVGVIITKQGQTVAEASWKGRGQWWSALQQVSGYVLNKNETPFAPLAWDYYEAIKARPAGM